jgi:hypothetical protein
LNTIVVAHMVATDWRAFAPLALVQLPVKYPPVQSYLSDSDSAKFDRGVSVS